MLLQLTDLQFRYYFDPHPQLIVYSNFPSLYEVINAEKTENKNNIGPYEDFFYQFFKIRF